MATNQREKIHMHILLLGPKTRLTPEGWRERTKILVNITNLTTRPLDGCSLEVLRRYMYNVHCWLLRRPVQTDLTTVRYRTELLQPLVRAQADEPQDAGDGPAAAEPLQLIETPPIGRKPLVMPDHPLRTSISALSEDPRNLIYKVTDVTPHVYRVVCPAHTASGEIIPGILRMSDYKEDGEMTQSVLCSFSLVRAECQYYMELHWKRKRKRREGNAGLPPRKRKRGRKRRKL